MSRPFPGNIGRLIPAKAATGGFAGKFLAALGGRDMRAIGSLIWLAAAWQLLAASRAFDASLADMWEVVDQATKTGWIQQISKDVDRRFVAIEFNWETDMPDGAGRLVQVYTTAPAAEAKGWSGLRLAEGSGVALHGQEGESTMVEIQCRFLGRRQGSDTWAALESSGRLERFLFGSIERRLHPPERLLYNPSVARQSIASLLLLTAAAENQVSEDHFLNLIIEADAAIDMLALSHADAGTIDSLRHALDSARVGRFEETRMLIETAHGSARVRPRSRGERPEPRIRHFRPSAGPMIR